MSYPEKYRNRTIEYRREGHTLEKFYDSILQGKITYAIMPIGKKIWIVHAGRQKAPVFQH